MFKNVSKVFLGLAVAVVAFMSMGLVANADKTVGVKNIKNGTLNYYSKSEYTGNVMTGDDSQWFEGALYYGTIKSNKIASNCKYYTWDFSETDGIYTKKITKAEFNKALPKSVKSAYFMTKDGKKYYTSEAVKIKIKNKQIVRMEIVYHP